MKTVCHQLQPKTKYAGKDSGAFADNPEKTAIFAAVLVSRPPIVPEDAMKRESGANPEQTRCCEFHSKF